MFFIYILQSRANGAYYIGSCKNVSIRLQLHNQGLVISTKRYAPWDLVHQEQFDNLKNAQRRELQIKKWKSRKSIENILKTFQN